MGKPVDRIEIVEPELDLEKRCECGQLIAKVQPDGLQMKCKRCKRIVVIPFTSIEGWTLPSPPPAQA